MRERERERERERGSGGDICFKKFSASPINIIKKIDKPEF